MKFVKETTRAAKNKASGPIRSRMLKKKTVTRNIVEGKRMITGLNEHVEGHHVGKFALDIIKQTRDRIN
jgi:hypothetical protein